MAESSRKFRRRCLGEERRHNPLHFVKLCGGTFLRCPKKDMPPGVDLTEYLKHTNWEPVPGAPQLPKPGRPVLGMPQRKRRVPPHLQRKQLAFRMSQRPVKAPHKRWKARQKREALRLFPGRDMRWEHGVLRFKNGQPVPNVPVIRKSGKKEAA